MSKDPFADLGFQQAQAPDPFSDLGFTPDAPPEMGVVQGVAQAVAQSPLKVVSSARAITSDLKKARGLLLPAAKEAFDIARDPNKSFKDVFKTPTPPRETPVYDYGYFGKQSPVGNDGQFNMKNLKDAVGTGLDLSSFIPVGAGAATVSKIGMKTLPKVLGSLALEGGTAGALQGAGQAMQANLTPEEIAAETASGAGYGAAGGVVLGGTAKVFGKAAQLSTKAGRQTAAVDKIATELDKIDSGYAGMRKANEFSPDQGKASKQRVANTNVLVDSVDDTGTIRTKQPGGAVDQYRSQTIDGAESVVRDNLNKLGERIDLPTVEATLTRAVKDSGLEAGDLVTALRNIKKEIAGLRMKADKQGTIPLTLVHDAKISVTKGINYMTAPEVKAYRKAIARGLKETVEENSSFNVKEVNHELSKYYEDVDLLERLDGKKVQGGKLGKYLAQLSGNLIGGAAGSIAGGPGAAIGGAIGGELASRLKSVSMMRTFGKGSGRTAPKSVVIEKAVETAKTPRLMLPAPKSTVRSEVRASKPIVLPSKSQSTRDVEMVSKFGKNYEKTQENNLGIRTEKYQITKQKAATPTKPDQKSVGTDLKKATTKKKDINAVTPTTNRKDVVMPKTIPQKVAKVQLPNKTTSGTPKIVQKTPKEFDEYLSTRAAEKDPAIQALNTDLSKKQLLDPKEGVVYFHGTFKENYDSLLKNGFDSTKNKKGFAEQPEAMFVGDLTEAGMYGDKLVTVKLKPGMKAKTISVADFTPEENSSFKRGVDEINYARSKGYDAINVGDELIILSPEKFEIGTTADLFKQLRGSQSTTLPKTTTGYHIVRDEKNIKKILKDGFSLKGFGKESGTAAAGDPMGAYFFPSKSAYKALEGWSDFPKEHVIKADLQLSNPYKVTTPEKYFEEIVKPATKTSARDLYRFREANNDSIDSVKITEYLKSKGYDGIIDKQGLLSYDEPQIIVFDTKKIKNITQNFAAAMGIPMTSLTFPQSKNENQSKLPTKEIKIEGRKATLSESDLKELGAVLYGEIGNRPGDRQEFESQVITNIILNRMESNHPSYKGRTATQLLSAKNEFQAYGGKRYQDFKNGTATETEKVAKINKFLDDLRDGKLPNRIDKALFYGHAKDNTIRVFNTWKEYKANLNKIK